MAIKLYYYFFLRYISVMLQSISVETTMSFIVRDVI